MKIPQECCVTLGVLLKTNGFISPLIVARGCPSSNPNRHKETQWQKWLFTASHGARMLRESNPQITTVDQHMEMRGKVMADIVIKRFTHRLAAYGDVADRAGGAAVGVTCAARGWTPAASRCGTSGFCAGADIGIHATDMTAAAATASNAVRRCAGGITLRHAIREAQSATILKYLRRAAAATGSDHAGRRESSPASPHRRG